MNHYQMSTSLDLIIGPMFSSKTTELVRRLSIFADMDIPVLYINTELDTRSDQSFSSHNSMITSLGNIDSIKIKTLLNIPNEALLKYDIIGIDEAQRFNDLAEFCDICVDVLDKKLIVAGLSGDFRREPFGQVHLLLSKCDSITQLYAYCVECKSKNNRIQPAIFTKRIGNEGKTIVIGAKEMYVPVCRKCY